MLPQVPERSLLVDLDAAPIRIVDSDIFINGKPIEAKVTCDPKFVKAELDCLGGVELRSNIDTEGLTISLQVFTGETKALPWYEGPYIVYPKYEDQELDTENKSMRSDVLVKEIGVARVTNLSGGYTVTIG